MRKRIPPCAASLFSRRRFAGYALILGLIVLCSATVFANIINLATATVNCTGYTLNVQAVDLESAHNYEIFYAFYCVGNNTAFFEGIVPIPAGSSTFTDTLTANWTSPLATSCTVIGSASLIDLTFGGSTFETDVVINGSTLSSGGATVTCPPTTAPCLASATNPSNFNGTSVPAGTYLWFNANFKANNVPANGVTIDFTNGNVAFTAGGTPYSLSVPNAKITFSTSATCSSTTFDSGTNTWITTVPIKGDDEIFLTGFAWPIPSGGLPGGANPVNFTGTYSAETSAPGLSIQMVWSAAAYSKFPQLVGGAPDYNSFDVKAGHQTWCGGNNGDHAGTPEGVDNTDTPWKNYLIGGPRGGGGSNFTGSWSGTLNITICPS